MQRPPQSQSCQDPQTQQQQQQQQQQTAHSLQQSQPLQQPPAAAASLLQSAEKGSLGGFRGGDWRGRAAACDGHLRGAPGSRGPVLLPPAVQRASKRIYLTLNCNINANNASKITFPADVLRVTVLGAGQDVGRSAVYVQRGERGLLFDCGSHLGAKQARKLPLLNLLLQLAPQKSGKDDLQTMEEALLAPSPLFACCTDATLISHFHMDHCGSLPSFTERLGYRNPIAMTFPTRALSPVLLLDSARIFKEAAFRGRQQLLSEAEGGSRDASLSSSSRDASLSSSSRDAGLSSSGSSASGEGRVGGPGASSQEQWNYTEAEAQRCMRRCVALRLHESWEAGGWTVTPYYAGHVLGAAMLHAQLPGGPSIVYTGDFNTSPDRHLGSASIPRLQPDLLISECTYASFVRPSKRITEREFCDAVHDALKKGGKVLIPVFAVGRAQELCMLLNSYWQRMQLQYPIYFGGGMTEKANKYYKLYVQWTGSDLLHRLGGANAQQNAFADQVEDDSPGSAGEFGAFDFSHISTLPPEVLTSPTPMVLLATPGMLHGGLALKALKLWAGGPENLVLLPGYCVRGTVGAMLIDGQRDIPLDARTRLKVLCKVRYMSFSAHADTTGIQQLARHLQPKAIMLVHGEKEGMLKLARVLHRELGVPVHTPPSGQTVSVPLDKTEPRVSVYIHDLCFRRTLAAPKETSAAAAANSREALWECEDPALTALLESPVMRRSAAKEEAGEAAEKESSSKELCAETPAEDLHLLMDLDSLVAAAAAAAANGCGSLKHCSSKQGHAAAPSGPRAAAADCAGVSPGNKEEIQFAPSAAGVGTAAAAAAAAARVPPRCIQLLSLRYRHEVEMEAAVFQQLLHLFMDYIVQCRKAYEQQRRQRSASGEAPAPLSLETPEFCDFGPQLKLRQMEGGGIIIEFLSLVAVHNGRDRLQMQWAETDERRNGAVSAFVEYFSRMAEANTDSKAGECS